MSRYTFPNKNVCTSLLNKEKSTGTTQFSHEAAIVKSGRLPSIPAYSTFDVRLPLAWPYCMPDAIHTANMKELMFNDRAGCILLRSGRSGPTIVNYPCVVPHKCTRRLMLFLSAHRCVPTIFWCIQIQDWKKRSWESRMYFHCISIR